MAELPEGGVEIKPYADLTGVQKDDWGAVLHKGVWKNIYTDEGLISQLFAEPLIGRRRIIDLGGSDGHLALHVGESLNTTVTVLDRNLAALAKASATRIGGDILSTPFQDETFEGAILRFTLPYIPQEKQPKALEEIYRILVPGGKLVVLHDGASDKALGRQYNSFFSTINAIISPSRRDNYYTSVQELEALALEAGFRPDVRSLDECTAYLSPQAYASRFHLTEEQRARLAQAFSETPPKIKATEEGVSKGQPSIFRPFVYAILEKPPQSD